MMIQYKKLFAPYTQDGHTIELAFRYWTKFAQDKGISSEIMELSINLVFNDLANGVEYPKKSCPCGCGIDKAATAIIHTVRDRMLELDNKFQVTFQEVLEQRHRIVVTDQLRRIAEADKKFIKMNRLPLKERSPVLCILREMSRSPLKERSPVLRTLRKIKNGS